MKLAVSGLFGWRAGIRVRPVEAERVLVPKLGQR